MRNILIDANCQSGNDPARPLGGLVARFDIVGKGEGGARDTSGARRGKQEDSPGPALAIFTAAPTRRAATARRKSSRSDAETCCRRRKGQLAATSRACPRSRRPDAGREAGGDQGIHFRARAPHEGSLSSSRICVSQHESETSQLTDDHCGKRRLNSMRWHKTKKKSSKEEKRDRQADRLVVRSS